MMGPHNEPTQIQAENRPLSALSAVHEEAAGLKRRAFGTKIVATVLTTQKKKMDRSVILTLFLSLEIILLQLNSWRGGEKEWDRGR